MRDQIASGKVSWGDGWNALAGEYPDLVQPGDDGIPILDKALGGGQDPNTGEWYGNAKYPLSSHDISGGSNIGNITAPTSSPSTSTPSTGGVY
jgi:hypothetical protein